MKQRSMQSWAADHDPLSGLRHIRNICRNARRRSTDSTKLIKALTNIEKTANQNITEAKKRKPEEQPLIRIKSLLNQITTAIKQLSISKDKEETKENKKEEIEKIKPLTQPIKADEQKKYELLTKQSSKELEKPKLLAQPTKREIIEEEKGDKKEIEKEIIEELKPLTQPIKGKEQKKLKLTAKPFDGKRTRKPKLLTQPLKREKDKEEKNEEIITETSEEETEERDDIVKESEEEDYKEIQKIVMITNETDRKINEIMKELNIEKPTQEKILQLDIFETIVDLQGYKIIIDHIQTINEKDKGDITKGIKVKQREKLEKIDKIRYKMFKKLELEIDEPANIIFGTISILYYLKKIGKEKDNLYKNMKRILEIDLDNEIRDQVKYYYREKMITKEKREKMLKNVKTNERYNKKYISNTIESDDEEFDEYDGIGLEDIEWDENTYEWKVCRKPKSKRI